jgi:hypothetical protein
MIEAIKNNPLSKTLEASRKTVEVLSNMMDTMKNEPPKIVSAVLANLSASGLLPFPGLAPKPFQARQSKDTDVFTENSTLEELKQIEKTVLRYRDDWKLAAFAVNNTELAFLKTRDSSLTDIVNINHYLSILNKEMTTKSNYDQDAFG